MSTVLLVEDDAAVRRVLVRMLFKQGHQVIEACNGPEACRIAGTYAGTIDLLITDVVMPKMGCDDWVRDVISQKPQIKVIYISGYSEEIIGRYGLSEAQSNFLQKPFTLEALDEKIREVLKAPGRCEPARFPCSSSTFA